MNITAETLYLIQLLGTVCAGGFIGEFYRTSMAPVSLRIFFAHFLAGSFLSFFVGYMFYYYSHNKPLALALGGLLSYQDEKFINRTIRGVIHTIITSKDNPVPETENPEKDVNN